MRSLFTFILLSAFCLPAHAQIDSTAIVTDMYQRAARFYEADNFTGAVSLLERAETFSPKPDARVLYLKIKSLNALYQTDASYGNALEKTLPSFGDAAKAQNYPPGKVQEIALLQQQFAISRNQQRSSVAAKSNMSGSVNSSTTSERQRPMITQQPEVPTAQKEINLRLYDAENKLLEPDFARANKLMKRSGVVKRIFGVLLIGYGVLEFSNASSLQRSYAAIGYDDYNPTGTYIVGGVCAVSGLILLTTSSGRKRGKILLKATQEKQRQVQQKYLSWSPILNFQSGASQYGLSMRLRF